MNFAKLRRCGKQFIKLGPRRSFHILENRIKTGCFNHYWRYMAKKNEAGSTWLSLVKRHGFPKNFDEFFKTISRKKLSCLEELYPINDFDKNDVIKQADEFVNKTFEILGSGKRTFDSIPWNDDFRLKQQNKLAKTSFDKDAYYKDIHIKSGKTKTFAKDIKVPWELSRFYHLFVIGQAYELTQDEKYTKAFVEQVSDWMENNQFLLGPNWVCPMDVGIRSINFVWGLMFFKSSDSVSPKFWEKFLCSMYDHFFYLENNWEVYDSLTSNHYISDLIGYFYLCLVFSDIPGVKDKTRWCYQELLREFEKQVFEEGTDYEGSTGYHKLVTEIFSHFYLLGRELAFPFSTFFVDKLSRMYDFIDMCSSSPGKFVKIGDNDSGRIMYYSITEKLVNEFKSKNKKTKEFYPRFGLSVLKKNDWHITLRHHAYDQYQPSGHFHNDVGSVTLAYKGKDIFIDPGTYLYTPSEVWRNHMRSVVVHNTFFLDGLEFVPFDYRLFALEIPAQINNDKHFSLEHDLYGVFELRAHRDLNLNETDKVFKITDWWTCIGTCQRAYPQVCWNFTLDSAIETKKDKNGWILSCGGDPLIRISSENIKFNEALAFASKEYGEVQKTRALRAVMPFELYKKSTIIIEGL